MKLTGKFAKEQDQIMRGFGYSMTWKKGSRGGHPVYAQDGFEPLELPCTPRDQKAARARLLRELRHRHPEHPKWRSMKKARKRTKNLGHKLLFINTRPSANPKPEPFVSRTSTLRPVDDPPVACVACGRRWLSDLDYSSRPCPSCGGDIRQLHQEAA